MNSEASFRVVPFRTFSQLHAKIVGLSNAGGGLTERESWQSFAESNKIEFHVVTLTSLTIHQTVVCSRPVFVDSPPHPMPSLA